MKIEMKKFQNLINNRINKKNSLVNMDVKRIYPLNKIAVENGLYNEMPAIAAKK